MDYVNEENIKRFLESRGFSFTTNSDDNNLQYLMLYATDYSEEDFKKIIDSAIYFSKNILKLGQNVSLTNIYDALNEIEAKVLVRIVEDSYSFIGYKKLGTDLSFKTMKKIFDYAKSTSRKETNKMLALTKQYFAAIKKINDVYNVLSVNFSNKELIDKFYYNCMHRLNTFWKDTEKNKLQGLFEYLKGSALTDEEIVKLSGKCSSIFAYGTKEKLIEVKKILRDFRDFIYLSEDYQSLDPESKDYIQSSRFVNILKRVPSITLYDCKEIERTIKYLEGYSLKELYNNPNVLTKEFKSILFKYRYMKLNFNTNDLCTILKNRISCLATPVSSVLNVLNYVDESFKEVFPNNNIDMTTLINPTNFPDVAIVKPIINENKNNLINTLQLFSKFMNANELFNYLKQDLKIALIDNQIIKEEMAKLILKTSSREELIDCLDEGIKSRFGVSFAGEKTLKENSDSFEGDYDVSEHRKIDIDINISEKSVVEILEYCGVSKGDITDWSKNFDYEKKQREQNKIKLNKGLLEELEATCLNFIARINKINRDLDTLDFDNLDEVELIVILMDEMEIMNNYLSNIKDLNVLNEGQNIAERYTYDFNFQKYTLLKTRLESTLVTLNNYLSEKKENYDAQYQELLEKIQEYEEIIEYEKIVRKELEEDPKYDKDEGLIILLNKKLIKVLDDLKRETDKAYSIQKSLDKATRRMEFIVDKLEELNLERINMIGDEKLDSAISTKKIRKTYMEKLFNELMETYGKSNANKESLLRSIEAVTKNESLVESEKLSPFLRALTERLTLKIDSLLLDLKSNIEKYTREKNTLINQIINLTQEKMVQQSKVEQYQLECNKLNDCISFINGHFVNLEIFESTKTKANQTYIEKKAIEETIRKINKK